MIRLIPFLVLTHTWWLAECIVLPSKPKSLVSAIYKSYMEDADLFLQSTKKTDSFRYAIIEKLDPMKSGEGVVPLMLVSILSSGGTDAETTLKPALLQVGAEVTGCSKYTCSCWMPLSQVPIYENLPQVQALTPQYRNQAVPGTTKSKRNRSLQAGSVINEALQAMMVDKIRSQLDSSINGQGISIGVLSTSFDRDKFAVTHYADDIQTNDLPNDVRVLEDGVLADQDQGRAMLQLIHDLAPNAKLLFHASGLGAENFSSGINKLADAGADVIVDDAIFFNQPFFQDGIIAQTANDVARLRGIPYFSAAGNYGRASYESPFVDSGEVATFPDGSECKNHKFGTDGNNQPIDFLRVTLDLATLMVLQWDEPFASVSGAPGAQSDLDFFAVDSSTGDVIASSAQPNINGDAVEILELPSGTLDLYICLYDGSPPGLFKFIEFGEAIVAVSPSVALDKSTSFGHRNTEFTAGVGAANFLKTPANGVTPPVLASYSSRGGTPILFDRKGNRLVTPIVHSQPRFVAVDGVSNTFYPVYEPNGNGGFSLFGTVPAASNAAAVAALLLQVDPNLSPMEVYNVLASTAIAMGPAGVFASTAIAMSPARFDFDSGAGLIDAFAAVDSIFPNISPSPSSAPKDADNCFGANIPIIGWLLKLLCMVFGWST